ncbi:nicotinate-nucleotide--dimethylbenzimidazole phosphoribosyltransferase [Kordiimonas sediminis]|uniref:Nicotinate-nucleotide--dimethylbenzimidazole phosphoribosyltransferase n=1 Tax=Kordiimonas sediminis TaxID=1735581 RepID=A0A919AX15_9PROT|nr:nicotinate-nucleotide--dimethylbenzimidazole phosphoribosyltransferase [Kordiimonas sediminis]GHF29252.1 nicotinate-nucleotide--dimethylbenzimidazole phosphoribosyltransferase [Kordiimonas sediminis]
MNSPFDDLRGLIKQLPAPDSCAIKKIRPALDGKNLSGALTDYLFWLGEWQGKSQPNLAETHICLIASSYVGGAEPEVITNYIGAASKGRAPVNYLCVQRGIGLRVLEMAPTMPFTVNPASPDWSEQDCMAAVAFGMEAAAVDADLLGLSDLAFGNEANALALICLTLDIQPSDIPGLDDTLRSRTEDLIAAYDGHADDDSLNLLQAFAGREIAAIVGGIIAARSRRIPLVLEGIGALAAATILWSLDPTSIAHCKFAAQPLDGTTFILQKVGLPPLLSDALGAGPGCAIAVAAGVLGAATDLQSVPAKL